MNALAVRAAVLLLAGLVASPHAEAAKGARRDLPPAIYAPDPSETASQADSAAEDGEPAPSVIHAPTSASGADAAPAAPATPDDYRAFCSAPEADGTPRDPVFVRTCLAATGVSADAPIGAPGAGAHRP